MDARARQLATDLHSICTGLLPVFRTQLEAVFLRGSVQPALRLPSPTGDRREVGDVVSTEHAGQLHDDTPIILHRTLAAPIPLVPVWDLHRVRADGLEPSLRDDYTAMTSALVTDGLEPIVTDDVEDAYRDGYLLQLWDLHQQGLDVDEVPEEFDRIAVRAGLAATVIGGLSLLQRMDGWVQASQARFAQLLRASIVGGDDLARTEQWYDGLVSQLTGRLVALGSNELLLASRQGQLDALTGLPEGALLGMLWVSRWPDPGVCPICLQLHMTLTDQRPGIDSHPACRCILVPLVAPTGRVHPVSFERFAAGYPT